MSPSNDQSTRHNIKVSDQELRIDFMLAMQGSWAAGIHVNLDFASSMHIE